MEAAAANSPRIVAADCWPSYRANANQCEPASHLATFGGQSCRSDVVSEVSGECGSTTGDSRGLPGEFQTRTRCRMFVVAKWMWHWLWGQTATRTLNAMLVRMGAAPCAAHLPQQTLLAPLPSSNSNLSVAWPGLAGSGRAWQVRRLAWDWISIFLQFGMQFKIHETHSFDSKDAGKCVSSLAASLATTSHLSPSAEPASQPLARHTVGWLKLPFALFICLHWWASAWCRSSQCPLTCCLTVSSLLPPLTLSPPVTVSCLKYYNNSSSIKRDLRSHSIRSSASSGHANLPLLV